MSEVQEGKDIDVLGYHAGGGSLLHAPLYQLSCVSRDGVSGSYRKR